MAAAAGRGAGLSVQLGADGHSIVAIVGRAALTGRSVRESRCDALGRSTVYRSWLTLAVVGYAADARGRTLFYASAGRDRKTTHNTSFIVVELDLAPLNEAPFSYRIGVSCLSLSPLSFIA